MKAALYARVSTHDQQTLSLQMKVMEDYAHSRGWNIVLQIEETSSGVSECKMREQIIQAARRREIDVIIVWKLDRWSRSLAGLVNGLQELDALGVGFVSITETLDFTTPSGKAMAGMLAVFAEFERGLLSERVKAGIAHARANGKPHGRPKSTVLKAEQVKALRRDGLSKSEIARRTGISRTSVRRILN